MPIFTRSRLLRSVLRHGLGTTTPVHAVARLTLLVAVLAASPAFAGAYDLVFVPPTPMPADVLEGSTVMVGVELQGGCPGYEGVSWEATAEPTFGEADATDFGQPMPIFLDFEEGMPGPITQIQLTQDMLPEPSERFELVLRPAMTGGMLLCGSLPGQNEYRLVIKILDDDLGPPPTPAVFIDDTSVVEGNAGIVNAIFDVTLDVPSPMPVDVMFQTADGTAMVNDGDYQGMAGNVHFNPFETQQQILIVVNGDTVPEPDESFSVFLTGAMGAVIGDDHAEAVIIDDDFTGPEIRIADATVTEGDSGITEAFFVVELKGSTPPNKSQVSVFYQTQNNSAVAGEDYVARSGTLLFGNQNKAFIPIAVLGDTQVEENESFQVVLSNPQGALIADGIGEGVILNDDQPGPPPRLAIGDASVAEGDAGTSEASFDLMLDRPAPAPVTVPFATADDTATAGVDYQASSGTVVIAAGERLAKIVVAVIGDTADEDDETFFVDLGAVTGAEVDDGRGVGTILDDEEMTLPFLSIADATVREGDAGSVEAAFTVSLSAPSDTAVTVGFATADDTATAGADYLAAQGTATFAPGEVTRTVAVEVVGDTADEDDETFFVDLADPQGAVVADGRAVGTIEDDDEPAPPALAIDDVRVVEGDAGTVAARFTVSLSAPAAGAVQVAFATADGSAGAGQDYVATSGTLAFDPGTVARTVSVTVRGDTLPEADETFFVDLSSPAGATIADGRGVGTIENDDAAVVPRLAIADVRVVEGNAGRTDAVFTVTLSSPAEGPVSVDFATRDDGATAADADYLPRTGTLVFDPGQTSVRFNVAVLGDRRVESDERFLVLLSRPLGATLARDRASGVIVNDDVALGVVRLASVPSVIEGAGRARIVVERAGDAGRAAEATLVVAAGSAQAGEDFQAVSRRLRWAAGERGVRTVDVVIVDDGRREDDETVAVSLSEPLGVRLGQPSTGTLVILDDDTAIQLEAVGDQERTARVGDLLTLAVRALRDGAPVAGATVTWEVEGAATLGADPVTVTDQDGTSRQTVRLGTMPGPVRVRARLDGTPATVAFQIRVEGNLADLLDGDQEPNQRDLAAALDTACASGDGEFAAACAYLFGLGDAGDRRRALRALTPDQVAVQGTAARNAPKVQLRNLQSRLAAVRGATGRLAADQLAFSIQGQGVAVGTVRQAIQGGGTGREGKLLAGLERAFDDARMSGAFAGDETPVRGGAAGADPVPAEIDTDAQRWGVFVNGRVSIGDAPRSGREAGYDFETAGITAGVDYRVSNQLVIGLAAGYLSTDADINGDAGAIDVSGYSLSAYGTWYRDAVYLEAVVGYGWNDYRLERFIDLPLPFQSQRRLTARGEPDGSQLSLDLGAGYEGTLGAAASLSGFARLSYVRATIDRFFESGAGPFDLRFGEQEIESLLSEVGLDFAYPWSLSWGVLQPTLRVAYLHEFADDSRLIRAAFRRDSVSTPFIIRTDDPDRDFFNVGAGLIATLRHGWSAYLQYDTDLARDDLDIYTVSGGLRMQF